MKVSKSPKNGWWEPKIVLNLRLAMSKEYWADLNTALKVAINTCRLRNSLSYSGFLREEIRSCQSTRTVKQLLDREIFSLLCVTHSLLCTRRVLLCRWGSPFYTITTPNTPQHNPLSKQLTERFSTLWKYCQNNLAYQTSTVSLLRIIPLTSRTVCIDSYSGALFTEIWPKPNRRFNTFEFSYVQPMYTMKILKVRCIEEPK